MPSAVKVAQITGLPHHYGPVLTLALGIAVTATMFSLVSAFLMPHLPGRDPQSVFVPTSINPDATFQASANPVSAANYFAWAGDTRLFSEMAAADEYRRGSLSNPGQQPEAIVSAAVTANYFTVFGESPQLGRAFLAGEDQPGHDHVVILSHGLWERRFGSRPANRRQDRPPQPRRLCRRRSHARRLPPSRLPHHNCWSPLTLTAQDRVNRKDRYLVLFARLAPGVTPLELARTPELDALRSRLTARLPPD